MPVDLEPVSVTQVGGRVLTEVVAAYDANERDLFTFALGVTRDGAAAEDIVQEAFLRLVRESRSGRFPDNARAWLYRVVREPRPDPCSAAGRRRPLARAVRQPRRRTLARGRHRGPGGRRHPGRGGRVTADGRPDGLPARHRGSFRAGGRIPAGSQRGSHEEFCSGAPDASSDAAWSRRGSNDRSRTVPAACRGGPRLCPVGCRSERARRPPAGVRCMSRASRPASGRTGCSLAACRALTRRTAFGRRSSRPRTGRRNRPGPGESCPPSGRPPSSSCCWPHSAGSSDRGSTAPVSCRAELHPDRGHDGLWKRHRGRCARHRRAAHRRRQRLGWWPRGGRRLDVRGRAVLATAAGRRHVP